MFPDARVLPLGVGTESGADDTVRNPLPFILEGIRGALFQGIWPNWIGLAVYAVLSVSRGSGSGSSSACASASPTCSNPEAAASRRSASSADRARRAASHVNSRACDSVSGGTFRPSVPSYCIRDGVGRVGSNSASGAADDFRNAVVFDPSTRAHVIASTNCMTQALVKPRKDEQMA